MNIDEITERLKAAGRRMGPTVVNADGRMVLEVDGVAMFHPDATDLVTGRATIEEIVARNRGKSLG